MDLIAKHIIPEGKRIVTKIVDNELCVYLTDSENIIKPVTETHSVVYDMYSDGGSRGNGSKGSVAGGGAVLYKGDKILFTVSEYFGTGITNNVSEYKALIIGLEKTISLGKIRDVRAHVDSKLVCEQVKGNWKINNTDLKLLHKRVIELSHKFKIFEIVHVLRNENKIADQLANEAMDRKY